MFERFKTVVFGSRGSHVSHAAATDYDDYDEYDDDYQDDYEPETSSRGSYASRTSYTAEPDSNIVKFRGAEQEKRTQFIPLCPGSLNEAINYCDFLKEDNIISVNVSGIENVTEAQRIVDYLFGATRALGGTTQNLGNDVFAFIPKIIDVTGGAKEILRSHDVFVNEK